MHFGVQFRPYEVAMGQCAEYDVLGGLPISRGGS